MKMSALIAVAVLLAPSEAPQKPSKDKSEAASTRIMELRKERITILKSAAEVSTKLAHRARIEVWDAMDDQLALLKAELDAAETEAERVSLYEKAVGSLKRLEELAKAQKMAARGTELTVLRINARRLEVEIQLAQARIKESR